MSLQFKVDTVPEGFDEHYTEADDGTFVLNVEGIETPDTTEVDTLRTELETTKQKVSQFRKTNTDLMKQIKEKGGEVKDDFSVDIDSAINEALTPIKEKNLKLEQSNAQLQSTLEEVVLSDKVKDIAIKHGVFESALQDIVSRARNVFTVKDGKPVPKDNKASRDEEGNVLSPEKWIEGLAENAPHLFKPSNGSGAVRPVGGHIVAEKSANQKIEDKIKNLK